ncbi:MAG TPA: hypothetical protein VKY19_15835 [Ktedonosporobacter sp.]|jgi:hypothetical protein|nr:hypothetical protein [Ktedonosporobacter sp.]
MAEQSTIEVGNAVIVLSSQNDPFSDGHTTGYLEFYDERHRPPFPLSCQVISDYLSMIVNEPTTSFLWKAGRLTGWIEALVENAEQTFRSFSLEEQVSVLQEV